MSDFDDFCGKHILNFDSINHQIVDGIVMMLETGASYSDILEWGGNSTDQLVHSACYAFSKGRLTREQMATLLELREIRNGFSMVQEHRLLDNHKQPFEQALQLLTSVLSRAEQETFLTLLTSKPQSEWCYFTFTIDPIELQNPKINALLEIAVNTHVIFKSTATLIQRHEFSEAKEDESSGQPKQNITILSVGCRDALNRSRYGEHAKALFPRIGVFTKDDIEFSMRNRGRYSAVSYPGIENSTQFHSVEARPFYLAVHDEIHRYFISTIPNKIYDALLYSVDVVRENIALPASPESSKTWSKGIWDCIDMEVSTFVGYTQDQRNNTSLELINQDFIALLSARIFSTNRVGGLFAPSPYIDTTWLLLIDMILNPEAWYKRSIDPTLFPINSMYKQMYDFIVSNKYRIDTTHSSATQVAILKSKYFDLPCSLENEMVFKKCKKNYLQVMVENIPIKLGKSVFLNLDSEPNNSQVLMDFIKDHRELIKITTNRVSFIGLVEKLSLISRDLLEKLLSDDILFSQVIDTSFDLIKVADQFVDYENNLIMKIIKDNTQFDRLIKNPSDLISISEKFPDYYSLIISKLIENTARFNRLIPSYYYVIRLSNEFPVCPDILIETIINDDERFERIVREPYILIQLADNFPNHSAALITKFFEDTSRISRLGLGHYQLIHLVNDYPGYADLIHRISNQLSQKKINEECKNPMSTIRRSPSHNFFSLAAQDVVPSHQVSSEENDKTDRKT